MKLLVFSLLLCGAWAQTRVERSTGSWQTYNGRSFIFQTSSVSWAHAQQRCLALGGSLATIHNSGEENFVKQIAKGQAAWIGLSDAQTDGFWFWINSDPLRYTNWCRGEPNNVGWSQECVVMNFSDNKCWDDERCSVERPFVCQK